MPFAGTEKSTIFANNNAIQVALKKVRRRKPSSIPAIVSISMVLFWMGLLGVLILTSEKIDHMLKENIDMMVLMNTDADEKDALSVKSTLDHKPFTKETLFVSKDDAAKEYIEEVGEDFTEILDFNPLPHSIELKINADYADSAKMVAIEREVMAMPKVREVSYQIVSVNTINANFKKVGTVLAGLFLLFLVVAILLINSTVRLGIYAKRFIIKSMQLVGATNWFIIKPFIGKAFLQALLGWAIACILLYLLIDNSVNFDIEVSQILNEINQSDYLTIAGIMLGVGLVVVMFSSYFATKKYLRSKIDDLY